MSNQQQQQQQNPYNLPTMAPPPVSAPPPNPRPLRQMLARGAACDLCRSRKVKCDGVRPVCSQCTKSARGNAAAINCVYEGVAAARSGGSKKAKPSATGDGGGGGAGKLKRTRVEQGSDDEEYGARTWPESGRGGGGNAGISPPENGEGAGERKRQVGMGGGQRVEILVDRISELERRLRLQAQPVPAEVHTYGRASASPPFYPSSMPMEGSLSHGRRSMSFSGEEPSSKEIAAAWTPESSVRRTLAGEPSAYAGAYASFIPQLGGGYENGDFSSAAQQGGRPQAMPLPTTFANGSSYPPLNYSPGLGLNGAAGTMANGSSYLGSNSSGGTGYQQPSPQDYQRQYQQAPQQQQQYPQQYKPQPDFYANPKPLRHQNDGFHSSSDTSLAASPDEPLSLDASLLQLLYPAWPPSLPLPATVQHLVTLFFTRAQVPASMINKARLLASLDLQPDDKGFPSVALLHAICAYASVLVSAETLGEGMGRKYWESEKTPRAFHYKCARAEIDKGVLKPGGNLFQVLQATILCSYIAYQSAEFTELWLLSGTATRLCTPLGLNHLPPWNFGERSGRPSGRDWQARIRQTPSSITHSLLPAPRDVEENYERAATFWAAFSIDRHASASTDWSTSIDELDISTHLPSVSAAPISSISLQSPTFLQEAAAPTGSLGLYVKAVVLLGRVVNFLQRLPRHEKLPEGESIGSLCQTMTSSPEFVELDFALSKFRATTSADFFNAGSSIDGHLASAYAIPHAASILLHEPFCDKSDRSPTSSIARCLTSAKCVVNSTYVLYQSSNDLCGIDPFLPYCWSVVGRALVRDHAVKMYWGDVQSAQFSRQLAEHCLSFSSRCNKVPGVFIGDVMSNALRKLLDNPEQLLPPSGSDTTCPEF